MKRWLLLVAFIGGLACLSMNLFFYYDERSLESLIYYNEDDVMIIAVTTDITKGEQANGYEFYLENREQMEELMAFLSTYQVKRVTQNHYQRQLLYGTQQQIFVSHYSHTPSVAFIGEAGVHLVDDGTYQVTNGPIDMKWLAEFVDKKKERNPE
ncbi:MULTISPECIES: hypothetical protein [Shouchella]|uniref:Lipoprotein n=3 Tax=Bacillaceae TaxID=186817 RepID=A0A060LY87_9BACI|nr:MULTISPECIES: hypothetical protein [Bacillaceae]RQW18818.1 hypothetical protein EH196_17830 [Bacillus sp. C1-1]AIC96211.1 hypothetical protein BleG1_3664 [Shouchella lehensis G1]KQL58775.1 hypothetical protein AN965_02080 [Alkalicoccobacillus plakortidis]MBG9785103.1 hypothetical protein [Shouchella lehensis]TES46537.1 hypothetical protein E2L03_17765 [Shouchella lehensis]